MTNKGRCIITDNPNKPYGYCSSLENIVGLEKRVSELLKDGLEAHPTIEGVKIASINLDLLPEDIKNIIDRIKGETKKIFDFCVVETENDIESHGHPEGVGEVYFGGDGGVNVIMGGFEKQHLKKGNYAIVGPGEIHGVKKVDDDISTFLAAKFTKI